MVLEKKVFCLLSAVFLLALVSCQQPQGGSPSRPAVDDGNDGGETPSVIDRSAAVRAYRDEVIGEWVIVPSGGNAYGDDRDRIVFSETSVFYRGSSYSLDVDSDVWDEKSYNASHSKPVNNFTARVPGDACLLVLTPDGYTSDRQNSIFINRGGDSDELWIEAELFKRKGGGSGSGGDVSGAWRYGDNTLTFQDGGRFAYSGGRVSAPSGGTYDISGSVITVRYSQTGVGGDTEESFDFSVDGDELKMTLRGDNAVSLALLTFFNVSARGITLSR